jgi:tetratricopeptide (TPR) repeat protein
MPTLCWWITACQPIRRNAESEAAAVRHRTRPRWPASASLALIRSLYDWEWQEARGLHARAIELNPGYATARHWLGIDWFALTGRFAEARAEIDIALQLDPLSSIIREGKTFIRRLEHRYDEAVQGYCELIADDPTFYKGYTSLGRLCPTGKVPGRDPYA